MTEYVGNVTFPKPDFGPVEKDIRTLGLAAARLTLTMKTSAEDFRRIGAYFDAIRKQARTARYNAKMSSRARGGNR